MQCPVCHIDLQMMERQGIEIDYCPRCRGVWLDRGELDKIIQRSGEVPYRDHDYEHDDRGEYHKHGRKRKSFWGELFDWD